VDRYALYLEFGTSKMPARPFLLRSLRENTAMLHRIFINTTAKEMARGKAK